MIYKISRNEWVYEDKSPYKAKKEIDMIEGMLRNKDEFNGDMYSSTNRTESETL